MQNAHSHTDTHRIFISLNQQQKYGSVWPTDNFVRDTGPNETHAQKRTPKTLSQKPNAILDTKRKY